MPCPLISVGRLRQEGVIFTNVDPERAELKREDGTTILRVPGKKNVYPLVTLMEAHVRLGHVSPEAIKFAAESGNLAGMTVDLNR